MPLTICTLTGVDETTDYAGLRKLSEQYPHVEFGVLLSMGRAGQEPRYPSLEYIAHFAGLRGMETAPLPQIALHVCGREAINIFINDKDSFISGLANSFDRVQLNLKAADTNMASLQQAINQRPNQTIITQHNKANANLSMLLKAPNHAVLFDQSGGTGTLPESWPAPLPGKSCGYAGGLGPDNMASELPKIHAAAAGTDYWIDMEGRLRNEEDRFDLVRAAKVLRIVNQFTPSAL